jgi:hypothetical protein
MLYIVSIFIFIFIFIYFWLIHTIDFI